MMRNYKQDHEPRLTVGYVSPGWPLSDFPSGVVAYIQNVKSGLGDKADVCILATMLKHFQANDNIIDLASFHLPKSISQSLLDKFFTSIGSSYLKSIQYKRDFSYFAKGFNRAIQKNYPQMDILEMEESFGLPVFLMKVSKIPIVVRLHGPNFIVAAYNNWQEDTDFKLRVLHEGKAIINSHGVTSPSMDVLQKVRDYYNIDLPYAKVIPNPIMPVNKANQWQLKPNIKPTILYVGRFESVKGGDLMLDAFRLIALKNKQVELVFVGPDRGVNLNGESIGFDRYLERFIPEDTIKKRIQFLGHCDSKTITDLRMSSLVTVVCSRYEVFCISLVEALATGCPTVATAVGGIKEIIVDNYNGLLAVPDSAESIAEKVLGLIDNPEKMLLLSKNAIKDCTERFSPKVIAAQTIDYYRSVLARC